MFLHASKSLWNNTTMKMDVCYYVLHHRVTLICTMCWNIDYLLKLLGCCWWTAHCSLLLWMWAESQWRLTLVKSHYSLMKNTKYYIVRSDVLFKRFVLQASCLYRKKQRWDASCAWSTGCSLSLLNRIYIFFIYI